MLLDPPVITKELHNFKSLCERCNRNPINVYTTVGRKERELLIQEIKQECDIKYNTGKNRYTLIPRMTKEEVKDYKKKTAGKMVYIEEEQQYIDIADNNVFSFADFDSFIIYYAYYGDFDTKNQLVNAIFHNINFYKIYNRNDKTLKKLVKKHGVITIRRAEKFINELLYRRISDSLTRLNKDHKIDMEEYYLANNKKISVDEMEPVIKAACEKAGHKDEHTCFKLLGDKYYTIRNQTLQEFIENNFYGFGKLLDKKKGDKLENFTIDYKHIKFHGIDKFAEPLTKEQQQHILNSFVGRFRERLRYRIDIGKKRSKKQFKRVIDINLAKEFFDIFENDLKMNPVYHTPQEFNNMKLNWLYDTNRVQDFKVDTDELM